MMEVSGSCDPKTLPTKLPCEVEPSLFCDKLTKQVYTLSVIITFVLTSESADDNSDY